MASNNSSITCTCRPALFTHTRSSLVILASIIIVITSLVVTPACCFVTPPYPQQTQLLYKNVDRSLLSNAHKYYQRKISLANNISKDDEIAELEAKLKQLKEQKQEEELSKEQQTVDRATYNDARSNAVEQVPLDEMLSESWKEKEEDSVGVGSIVSSLLTGLALVAAFVLFSQIPVGQEGLDKYSTAKPSTTIDLGDKNPVSRIEIN